MALNEAATGTPAPAPKSVNLTGLLAALAALVIVVLLPHPAALPAAGQNMLGLLLFSVILWITEAVDYAVSGVLIAALMTFLLGMAPNVVDPEVVLGTGRALTVALSGFTSSVLVLVAAACFLSAAMTITGLDRRIALLILSKVGARSNRVLLGAILVGIVLSFLVPSSAGRVAFMVPVIMGIILAFGVDQRSRFAGMLMIATAQTATIWNVGVKTASSQNSMAIGFIEKAWGQTITWGDWLLAAAPWSITMSVALYFVMLRMMPPETSEIAGGKETIRIALHAKGPMSWAERKLLFLTLILLGFWATEKVLHPFDTASTAIAIVALMFTPGIGVMSWKQAQSRIPWGILVLFGSGVSLGAALLQTGAAAWLAHVVVANLGLPGASAFVILALLSLFLIVVHLGFASATALTTAMVPTMIGVLQEIAVAPGEVALNLAGMAMLLQFAVNFGFILPVNSPQNMVAYGTGTFAVKDFVKTGLVLTVIGYALVLLLGSTYWSWMGYMTR